MKFEQLPEWLQVSIAKSIYGMEEDTLQGITEIMSKAISTESPAELFSAWLEWEGILGFSERIHQVHDLLFQPDTEKLELIKALKELYLTCESEYPEDQWEQDYPQILRAKKLLEKEGITFDH